VKFSKCAKGEGSATSDVSEVVTSKMSCPEVNECLKGKIQDIQPSWLMRSN